MDIPFVAKFNSNGVCTWFTNSQHKYGSWATGGITTLSNGVSYYSGFFGGPAKFGTDSFASTGLTDIFLAEVTPSGVITSGTKITSMGGGDEPQCITHDSSGNVYVGGSNRSSLTLNGVSYPFQGGESDGFIAKWGTNCTVGIAEQESMPAEDLFLYPNPAKNSVTLRYSARTGGIITITSAVGQKMYNEKVATEGLVELSTQQWLPGIYFVTLQSNAGDCLVQKLIIIK